MPIGPFVFGQNRLGLWAIDNSSLADKLRYVLPAAKSGPLPNLTDVFLPVTATMSAKDVVRQNNLYAHVYAVARDFSAVDLAKQALGARRRLGTGAIEFDLEGSATPDGKLAQYATDLVASVRTTNPNLPIRLNVPPYKGYVLPVDLINTDPFLYVIAQAYYGNMDGRLSEAEVYDDLLAYGIAKYKIAIHYAVMAGPDPNKREVVLPGAAYKPLTTGSIYSDDLLIASGLLS